MNNYLLKDMCNVIILHDWFKGIFLKTKTFIDTVIAIKKVNKDTVIKYKYIYNLR